MKAIFGSDGFDRGSRVAGQIDRLRRRHIAADAGECDRLGVGLAASGEHANDHEGHGAEREEHQQQAEPAAEVAAEHRSEQCADAEAGDDAAPSAHEAGLRRGGGGSYSGRGRSGVRRSGRRGLGRFFHRRNGALLAQIASAAEALRVDIEGRATERQCDSYKQNRDLLHRAILRKSAD
jgi:hypothetical protein